MLTKKWPAFVETTARQAVNDKGLYLVVHIQFLLYKKMAGTTRLELATFGVTGRRSNQLNYVPAQKLARMAKLTWAEQDSNLRPPACKADALPLS